MRFSNRLSMRQQKEKAWRRLKANCWKYAGSGSLWPPLHRTWPAGSPGLFRSDLPSRSCWQAPASRVRRPGPPRLGTPNATRSIRFLPVCELAHTSVTLTCGINAPVRCGRVPHIGAQHIGSPGFSSGLFHFRGVDARELFIHDGPQARSPEGSILQ